MAKAINIKAAKKRATKYEKPVVFSGSFEDMIAISIPGAGAKKKTLSETYDEMWKVKSKINQNERSPTEKHIPDTLSPTEKQGSNRGGEGDAEKAIHERTIFSPMQATDGGGEKLSSFEVNTFIKYMVNTTLKK